MSFGVCANPYIQPGRRDHQRTNARQRFFVSNRLAVSFYITEASTAALAANAGLSVGDVSKSGFLR
jgi:hypothetical protein